MDRIALAQRLEGLSKIFVANSPYHRDLRAMAHVLTNIDDDKFKKILSADFTADKEPAITNTSIGLSQVSRGKSMGIPQAKREKTKEQRIQDVMNALSIPRDWAQEIIAQIDKKKEDVAPQMTPTRTSVGAPPHSMAMEASENEIEIGKHWNRQASDVILDNLLRDVLGMEKTMCCDTGRKLDKNQVPDGKHADIPERAPTLKPEQTPDVSKVIESDIVEKSQGAVRKEAGAESFHKEKAKEHAEKAEDLKEEAKEHAEEAKETMEKAEKAEDKAEKSKEKAEKAEKSKEKPVDKLSKDKKESKKEVSDFQDFEGIELTASMDDLELSAEESEKLNKLFV